MPPKRNEGVASKKARAAAEAVLTDAQKAALQESRDLLDEAMDAGSLVVDRPDQYPRLAPSKGASD